MNNSRRCVLSACLMILLAGCSTPATRIEENLDAFNSYPLEVQSLIREGKIEIGFTHEMVRIALGEPHRTYQRKTSDGLSEVWSYVDSTYVTERQRANVDVPVYDQTGRRHSRRDWIWVDVQKTEEFEKLRIEFAAGKVRAIETIDR